ncbi:oxalate decarboxylase/phosphoglucose isomerase-like protein (cupin superfamily) [Kroppenstedtia sanguinis]|uniref:Cupin domain-containing protein n=1 Tax=Kroppenstedtia sanguinis TaxID=1380684 RepID=A0ABW4CD02_9BACL
MGKIDPKQIPIRSHEWGITKWLVSSENEQTQGAQITFGQVDLMPGEGHERHNHEDAEEILFVLSGHGEQMINDEPSFPIRAEDTLYIPKGVFHSTFNTGWEPLRLLAIYNPGGAEKALQQLPDYREIPVGKVQKLTRPE